jgi:hypothetical protein
MESFGRVKRDGACCPGNFEKIVIVFPVVLIALGAQIRALLNCAVKNF